MRAEAKVEAPAEAVEPPGFLNDVGKTEWRRMFPVLRLSGILTLGDLALFGAYCRYFQQVMDLGEKLDKSARMLKTPNGSLQTNPLVSQFNRASELLLAHMKELGMTPASRARMAAPEPLTPNGQGGQAAAGRGGKFAGLTGR